MSKPMEYYYVNSLSPIGTTVQIAYATPASISESHRDGSSDRQTAKCI